MTDSLQKIDFKIIGPNANFKDFIKYIIPEGDSVKFITFTTSGEFISESKERNN